MDYDEDIPTNHLVRPPRGTKATILLAMGSYSPPTNAHLRLLVAARDTLCETHFVAGAYVSPVSSAYDKPGLAPAVHRLAMCRAAVADIPWVVVMSWEARQPAFVPTYRVVKRLLAALREWGSGDGGEVEVFMVCGEDLRLAMRDVTRWPLENAKALERVVRFAVKGREGTSGASGLDVNAGEVASDITVEPWVGDLSSTVLREHVRKGWSILFMTPAPVVEYIQRHKLFR